MPSGWTEAGHFTTYVESRSGYVGWRRGVALVAAEGAWRR